MLVMKRMLVCYDNYMSNCVQGGKPLAKGGDVNGYLRSNKFIVSWRFFSHRASVLHRQAK